MDTETWNRPVAPADVDQSRNLYSCSLCCDGPHHTQIRFCKPTFLGVKVQFKFKSRFNLFSPSLRLLAAKSRSTGFVVIGYRLPHIFITCLICDLFPLFCLLTYFLRKIATEKFQLKTGESKKEHLGQWRVSASARSYLCFSRDSGGDGYSEVLRTQSLFTDFHSHCCTLYCPFIPPQTKRRSHNI